MTGLSAGSLLRVDTGGVAVAAFTARVGGAATGPYAGFNLGRQGDDPAGVVANRRALADAVGADPARAMMLTQVHGAEVRDVTGADVPRPRGLATFDGWPVADGLATSLPGVALIVLAADCLPVLAWRRDGKAVAAAHAGWRGLVAGVLEAAVARLGDPADVGVALGPRIGPCCYPVSDDVRAAFAGRFGADVVRGDAVDLAASARVALVAAGVPSEAIAEYGGCTACTPGRFFSHRASGGVTGRQAGLVMAVTGREATVPAAGAGAVCDHFRGRRPRRRDPDGSLP